MALSIFISQQTAITRSAATSPVSRRRNEAPFLTDTVPHLSESRNRSFTHVISTTQFSVLGLVLLACLATVCHVTGVIKALDAEAQERIDAALERFAAEESVGFAAEALRASEGGVNGLARARAEEEGEGEDLGEVLKRDDGREEEEGGGGIGEQMEERISNVVPGWGSPGGARAPTRQDGHEQARSRIWKNSQPFSSTSNVSHEPRSTPVPAGPSSPPGRRRRPRQERRKTRKKGEGGSAIDDLFSGLE